MATKTNDNKFQFSKCDKIFGLVKDENNKVNIVLAGYAVSQKKFDTFDQADRYIGTKPYELIINSIYVVLKQHESEKTFTTIEETESKNIKTN